MHGFWKAAVTACGLSGIAAFVFWSLYKHWLQLEIFERLNQEQTFIIMLTFLALTFLSLCAMMTVYLLDRDKSSIDGQTPNAVPVVPLISLGYEAKNLSVAQNMEGHIPLPAPMKPYSERLRGYAKEAGLTAHSESVRNDSIVTYYFNQLHTSEERDLFNIGFYFAQWSAGLLLLRVDNDQLHETVRSGLAEAKHDLRVLLAKYGCDRFADGISETMTSEQLEVIQSKTEAVLRRSVQRA